MRSREELVDFLQWKGSTHVIDQTKAKRTDQNGLKMMNQASKEKGQNGTREEHEEHKTQSSQTESWRTQGG
jgi:hypothetical protein